MSADTSASPHTTDDNTAVLQEIHNALRGLRYGSVEITVHNGQVVQIERKEKFRLQAQGSVSNATPSNKKTA